MRKREVTITPEMATKMLEVDEEARSNGHEIRHRNVSGYTVGTYAADMSANNWHRTHQGMALCETGEIIDGRHRLYAVLRSEKPITTEVTDQLTEAEARQMIKYIDGGRPRTVATQLWLSEGVEESKSVVAAIRCQWGLATGRSKEHGGSTSAAIAAFNAQSKSLMQIILIMTSHTYKVHSALLGPIAYYAYAHQKEASEFATSYSTGEHLNPTSAVLWLKRTFENRTHRRYRHRMYESSLIVCEALLAYHEGRRCGAVFRPSEKAREWLIGEAPKLTKVLIETAPKYVAKQDRWIPMGER